MPRASTQNARPGLRRLLSRPSRMVQAVVSSLLPLFFRSQGLVGLMPDTSQEKTTDAEEL